MPLEFSTEFSSGVDCLMLFEYIKRMRGVPQSVLAGRDFSDVNAEFLRSISVTDLQHSLHPNVRGPRTGFGHHPPHLRRSTSPHQSQRVRRVSAWAFSVRDRAIGDTLKVGSRTVSAARYPLLHIPHYAISSFAIPALSRRIILSSALVQLRLQTPLTKPCGSRLLVSEFRKIAVLILSLRKSNKSEKPSPPATN
jgi:hypothetical protein